MGKCEKNQERLLAVLRQCGRLSVTDAVSILNASEATVRRCFVDMASRGIVMRIYGGICLAASAANEYHFDTRALCQLEAKREIARAAAALIDSHDRLFFDSGTTVRECGNELAERVKTEELSDIAIVTNSLVYNESLARACTVNMIGGTIRMARMDLCGMSALAMLGQYNFTKAFLGVDGISESGELTTTDEETSLLAKMVVEHSREVLILADSSKLGHTSFSPYGSLVNANFTLITDCGADKAMLDKLSGKGVRIIQPAPKHL